MSGLLRWARPWVVRTRRMPGLRAIYRGVHARRARQIVANLPTIDGTSVLVRERSSPEAFEAGISDLDLVVVLHDDATGTDATGLVRAARFLDGLARAQRAFPLVRDVHLFLEDELRATAALGGSLTALLPEGTRRVSGAFDVRTLALPSGTHAGSMLAQELVTYATLRAARQFVEEPRPLAGALAAHALAKAESLRAFAEGREHASPARVAEAHGRVQASARALPEDVVEALRRLRDARPSEAPEAERVAPASRFDHAGILRLAPAIEAWAAPLLRHPAIRSVALLADTPSAFDLRLAVVVDPDLGDACEALLALARHRASTPPPPLVPGGGPLRVHVVPPSLLARPGRLRLASLEPWLRASAHTIGAPLPTASIGRAELARGAVLGAVFAASAFRERAASATSADERARASAIVHGFAPALDAFLRGHAPCPPRAEDGRGATRAQALAALALARSPTLTEALALGRAAIEGR